MRSTTTKRISSWAPATAIAMYCLAPASAASDVGWGRPYEDANHRTANTVVVISSALPHTASFVRTSQTEDSQESPPWRQPLTALREDLHATVSQLAQALGVRRQSVHAWQRGDKAPSTDSQLRISQLQIAATTLKAGLGSRLPVYLNFPLSEAGESFWDLVAAGTPANAAALILVEAATASTKRRRALDAALEGFLGEPLDGQV